MQLNQKRMPSSCTSFKANMTVEAALVLPLFLFGILFLYSLIEIIRLQSEFEQALHQYGKKAALHSYAYDKLQSNESEAADIIEGVGFSILFLKKEFENIVGQEYLEQSPLVGGKDQIQYLHSKFMDEDLIDLILVYRATPYYNIFKSSEMILMNMCRLHAWTGYDLKKNTKTSISREQYVYITNESDVYHINRNCTHLVLSIQQCTMNTLEHFRNNDGGRYSPCEICEDNSGTQSRNIYITESGTKYHSSIQCSGLKRTAHVVPLSEAGARRPCSRCSK